MNASQSKNMVLVSMLVVSAVVGYDLVKGELANPSGDAAFRTAWSIAVLFLLLAIMADTVPGLAGPFAGLVALAVLIGRGASVKQLTQVIPSPSQKGASS